ncbi:MAG TPA: DUF4412 domain-containing protein [Rariglobus sp.]|nr:DUF4412 domain-containing protein [Rariglobus sp.]
MIKLLRAPVYLVLLAALPLCAASRGFEGKFQLRIQDTDGTRVVSGAMKPDFMRMEIPSGSTGNIIALADFVGGEVAFLLPGQAFYATMPVRDAVGKLGEVRRNQSRAMLHKTTETVVLLEQTCIKYIAKDKDGTTEIWVAPGLASQRAATVFQSLACNTPERDLITQGGMPLRIIGKSPAGAVNFRMDVVSLEKLSLADSVFLPPAGCRKLDLGNLSTLLGP